MGLLFSRPCLPWQISTKLEAAVTRCEDASRGISSREKCISRCALQWVQRWGTMECGGGGA